MLQKSKNLASISFPSVQPMLLPYYIGPLRMDPDLGEPQGVAQSLFSDSIGRPARRSILWGLSSPNLDILDLATGSRRKMQSRDEPIPCRNNVNKFHRPDTRFGSKSG